jgi:FeS assembly SUF system regulator
MVLYRPINDLTKNTKMIKMSRMADYAVVLLATLVGQPTALSTGDLAGMTQVSVPTVRKLMKQLLEAGLVASVQGARGGYRLASLATEIRLTDIVAAIDGGVAITECAKEKSLCDRLTSCDLAGRWREINRELVAVLDRYSLQDLVAPKEAPLTFMPLVGRESKRDIHE